MSEELRDKIKKWIPELGYKIIQDSKNEKTNFILITRRREAKSGISFSIISPKLDDSLIVSSTSIMMGKGAEPFLSLTSESKNLIKLTLEKNALLANLDFQLDISEEKIEINISDNILPDGITKDRIFDIIKKISSFYEFIAYVSREHGINPRENVDKDLV